MFTGGGLLVVVRIIRLALGAVREGLRIVRAALSGVGVALGAVGVVRAALVVFRIALRAVRVVRNITLRDVLVNILVVGVIIGLFVVLRGHSPRVVGAFTESLVAAALAKVPVDEVNLWLGETLALPVGPLKTSILGIT